MRKPSFLDNPRAHVQTPRREYDPQYYCAGSVYRAGLLERLWRRFFGR